MGAPGLTSPIRSEAFENLQLNAGIMLYNFNYDSYTDAASLKAAIASAVSENTNILGVTRGGGSFTVTRELRQPEVDGMRYNFVGGNFVDSADANLSTTLLEVTPANIKMLLGTGQSTTSGKKTTIRMKTAIDPESYLTNVVWVGDISDGGYVLIALKNALNTADFSLTYTDKGEGTLAAEFHAHQADVLDYDYAPFEIIYLDELPTPGVVVTPATATIKVGGTITLSAVGSPAGGSVAWSSDNTTAATVNASTGVVTGAAVGTASIICTYTKDTQTATASAFVRVIAAT